MDALNTVRFQVWNMHLRNKLRFTTILIITFITFSWRRLFSHYSPRTYQKSTSLFDILQHKLTIDDKIVIGIVSCIGGYESVHRGDNETKAMREATEEPITLIKSILISAKIWKANQHIEFHIFTDSWMLKASLKKKLEVFNIIMGEYIKMSVHFHNVFKSVPEEYERDFIDNKRRCSYVRSFFPSSIPAEIKEILYFDTDVIITGNIVQTWNNFKTAIVTITDPAKPPQLAALVQNSEGDKDFENIFADNFAKIPHVPPRGVNSGVMFMNLDAMRAFNWSEKILKIFMERRATIEGDQQLINILFHDNLDRLTQFPCQYNFQHLHCEKGLTCRNLTTDAGGIHIMHGAGGAFQLSKRSHSRLYQDFKRYNLELHQDVEKRLFEPLRKYYSRLYDSDKRPERCQGNIGKFLFKQPET